MDGSETSQATTLVSENSTVIDFDIEENSECEDIMMDVSEDEEPSDTEEDELDERKLQAIASLENLVLSVLSQLTQATREKEKSGDMANGRKPKITLNLVRRGKGGGVKSVDGGCAMRSVQFPRKSVGGSSKSLARLLKVIDISHGALLTETPVTKRDIYYHDVNLFKSQSVVDSLVDDLAATFSLARADLNIRASSKGLFCGAGLVLHMRGGGRVVGDDTKGTLVPVGEDIFRVELDENIAWILVVEKDAVFQTLCTLGLAMNVSLVGPGIIITGKGYPDLATRHLVKTLSDNLTASIPIMALVDADPYGIDIMSVYRYGSERMRHESDTLAAGRVQWIGVKTSELSGIGIEKESLIPISVHDHKKALSMLRSRPHMPAEWRKELQYMLQTRCKAEIEVISCTRTALEDKSRLEDMNSDRRIHPLVSYLIRKINETIASSS